MDLDSFYKFVFSPIITKSFREIERKFLSYRDFLAKNFHVGSTQLQVNLTTEKAELDRIEKLMYQLRDYCGTYEAFCRNKGERILVKLSEVISQGADKFEITYFDELSNFLVTGNVEFPTLLQCEDVSQSYKDLVLYMRIFKVAKDNANSDIQSLLNFIKPHLRRF